MLLPVKSGERGLRQSDAVFHHTQQLWQVVSAVIDECGKPDFIGASYAPRDAEGSYMPCFTVGLNTAKCLSSALGVPLYEFSHQAGHVAAAVYSSGHIELFDREFIAFHVSGGTTELLERIARKRGMLISGGEANTERAAIMLLDEFRSAAMGRITLERIPQ